MTRLSSIVALAACFAACSFGCSGGDTSGTGDPVVDSGVETEPDTSTGDLGVDTTPPDTGSPEDTMDTSIVDSGADTDMPDTADTATPDTADTEMPDTADTEMPDTEMPDTADTAITDTFVLDTTPACTVGGACDDGNACTVGTTYDSTCVCSGGTPLGCDDSNICTTDSCNTASGCVHTPTSEGASCGPGKKCNVGVCAELCTPGATCDDSNACTVDDKFNDTCVCVGTTRSCDDTNSCTTDSCNVSSGCVNTAVANGTACGTSGSGNTCQSGVCRAPLAPPTVTFVTPTEGFMRGFDKDVSSCQSLPVTVNVTAAAGIQTVSWHLFTPTLTGPQMTGSSCGAPTMANPPWVSGYGNPMYPFKLADSEIAGKTSGTFTEHLDAYGNFNSVAPWLFCTQPGTGGTAAATALDGTAIPAVSTAGGGLRALADYCHSDNSTNAAGRQWTLVVRVVDNTGATATAVRKFIVHDI